MSGRENLAPPHSDEAEHAVLAALLFDNRALDTVGAFLEPSDFYGPANGAIYRTVVELIMSGKPADALTVHERGGHELAHLVTLSTATFSARHAKHYAEIVRERSVRRLVMGIAADLHTAAKSGAETPVQDAIDRACNELVSMLAGNDMREPRLLQGLLMAWIDELSERAEGKTDAISTGLVALDRLLAGGVRPGELVIIGARPSMGKSALSLTMARSMARESVVWTQSMEDSEGMLISRHVAASGRINLADIRRPDRAKAALWDGVTEGVERLTKLRLWIDDAPALTLRDIRTKAQQVRRKAGRLDVMMVDYLQLMEGDGETRAQELTKIARGLKQLAKEMNVAVVVMSQLSREADKVSGPPRLDHLAESGGIEQAADVIGLLWREHRSKPKDGNKHDAQVEIVKNKNGPTGTVKLWFDGATQRFEDTQQGGDYE